MLLNKLINLVIYKGLRSTKGMIDVKKLVKHKKKKKVLLKILNCI